MPLSELIHTRTGSGEPIVLIHGIGHRRQAWDQLVERLSQNHEVIAMDLAGFGESPAYPKGAAYAMPNAVKDLSENFAVWGISRPHVVGNSLGGAIALELALSGHARSVTALSPAGFFNLRGRAQAVGALLPLWLASFLPAPLLRVVLGNDGLRAMAGRVLYTHPERFTAEQVLADALSMRGAKGFLPTLLQAPHYSFSGQPPVPVTIAWGDKDLVLSPKQAEVAKERLPHAHHVLLPNCGHVPMSDDPELVSKIILDTVAKAEIRRAS